MIRVMMIIAANIAGASKKGRKEVRILIVDDNHAIGETLSEIFRAHRYQVEFINSGRDALRKI